MDPVRILCPKCRVELRLRDRGLLGRRGRCPRCRFRFVLQEADETELESAKRPPEEAPGTAPQSDPDALPLPQNTGEPTPQPAPTTHVELEFAATPPADSQDSQPFDAELFLPLTGPSTETVPEFAAITDFDQKSSGVRRLKQIKRRNAKRRNVGIIAGIAVVLAVLLAGIFFASNGAFSGWNGGQAADERAGTSRVVP